MHLYYARIMQALLFHQDPGIFPQYYTIKHVLPPYSLYYYLLIGMGRFVGLVAADKLVICLYVVLFLFGMRFLARGIGPAGDIMAVLIAPLVLNWPLGMGFVNFCLSMAVSLWALGLWCRVAKRPDDSRAPLYLLGFVVLCFAIMMTHPVPLLFVLGFGVVEYTIRLVRGGVGEVPNSRKRMLRDGTALVLALSTLLYVRLFTTHNVMQQVNPIHVAYLTSIGVGWNHLARLRSLDAFAGHGLKDISYRIGLMAILITGLVTGFADARRSRRANTWTLANTWFVLCMLLAVTLPIIPPDLNNSHYFSARLVILVWISALIGASGSQLERIGGRRATILAGSFTVVFVTAIMMMAVSRINPVARQIAEIETMPLPNHHEVGLMLHSVDYDSPTTLAYDPYYWSGVRLFRREDSVLYTTPWLDLAIIPVGAQPIMPTGRIDLISLEWEVGLRKTLLASSAARSIVFPQIDMAMVNHGIVPFAGTVDPVLMMDRELGHQWNCGADLIFTLCRLDVKQTKVPQ